MLSQNMIDSFADFIIRYKISPFDWQGFLFFEIFLSKRIGEKFDKLRNFHTQQWRKFKNKIIFFFFFNKTFLFSYPSSKIFLFMKMEIRNIR